MKKAELYNYMYLLRKIMVFGTTRVIHEAVCVV